MELNEIDYMYDVNSLLDRAYNSFVLDRKKLKLVPPNIEKKDRKTYIHNFTDICNSINRNVDDIRIFIGKELSVDTSIKENGALKIDTIIKSSNIIENVIKKYIIDHVMCKLCKSCRTKTHKIDRILYLECETCKSKCAIEK